MSETQYASWSELAESRSKNYWFLARFYLERPEPGFLAELSSALTATPSVEVNQPLSRLNDEIQRMQTDDSAIVTLQKEYTRLFRGLREGYGPPPPYESVYRENHLVGDTTSDVIHHYRQAGFGDIDETAGPQDHLGVELKFMSLLCYQEHAAWSNAATAEALQHIEQQQAFLDQHLMTWQPAYCERIIRESQAPFYIAVAQLTLETLQPERSLLEEISRELDAA